MESRPVRASPSTTLPDPTAVCPGPFFNQHRIRQMNPLFNDDAYARICAHAYTRILISAYIYMYLYVA
jgi:hypothetical protein